MKDWKSLEHAAQYAKTEREKRKAYIGLTKVLERASLSELEKIIESTKDSYIKKRAETEIWWRSFDKKPENLLAVIQTTNDKDKIEYAVIEIGNLKYRGAIDTLISFLDDVECREAAAMALRAMPTQKAFKPLVESIKRYPDYGPECLLYALQVIDCSGAAELLVDLFISAPNAPVVRDDIFVCFSEKAVKRIPKQVKDVCCSKILKAIEQSQNKSNTKELGQLYEVLNEVEEA